MAKAAEILGEKWTMLIVRELLMGATRFNGLQRGLSLASPTLLTKRMNELADAGVILKKKIQGQARREERGLVPPNERRATPHAPIGGTTRGDGAIFPPCFVTAHSCAASTSRSQCLAGRKNGRRRCGSRSVNRP